MKELYNLGLSEIDIKNIIETYPEIKDLTDEEIAKNIEILKNINCNDKHIRNILIANPYYLNRSINDIKSLIMKLKEINIVNINLLFDSNPFLLNRDSYEIDEYIKKELEEGKKLEIIVDELESNPYIIDEK